MSVTLPLVPVALQENYCYMAVKKEIVRGFSPEL